MGKLWLGIGKGVEEATLRMLVTELGLSAYSYLFQDVCFPQALILLVLGYPDWCKYQILPYC